MFVRGPRRSRRLRFACLAACLGVGLGVASCEESAQEEEAAPDLRTPEERGEAHYQAYCAPCHGVDLSGYAADNANALNNQAFLSLATDAFLRDAIVYGRPGTPMSGWGETQAGPLDAQAVEDVVAFLRAQQTAPSLDVHDAEVSGSAIKGQAVWNAANCGDCHGEAGEGGPTAMSVNNPWFLATASDGYLQESIKSGRPGTAMLGFDGTLQDPSIGDLVALIRSWQVPVDATPIPPFTPSFDPDRDIINPGGGSPNWTVTDGRFVAADAVKAAIDAGQEMIVLDARPHSDFVDGRISGAVSIPFYDLELVIEDLPKDIWIVNYCGCPHTVSGLSFDALQAAGFTNIAVLDEGYYVWVERGYPIEQGAP